MTDNTNTYELSNHAKVVCNSYDTKIPHIRFWTTPEATSPTIGSAGSGGLDLYVSNFKIEETKLTIYTGTHMEIPRGHVGLLMPRSSTGVAGMRLKNTVGVIDSDYRGEVMIVCDRFDGEEEVIAIGKKVAQLLILPVCPFAVEQVGNYEDLTVTSRDTGGFGSTGE